MYIHSMGNGKSPEKVCFKYFYLDHTPGLTESGTPGKATETLNV